MSKAIVIAGAAARGSFAAGVLASMSPVETKDAALYGTSSGALNSVIYAYQGPLGLLKQWDAINTIDDVYEFNGTDALWLPGLYNSSPIYKKALAIVSNGRPQMPVTVTVANVKSGEAEYYAESFNKPLPAPIFAAAVAQSASIPGLCCDKNDWTRVDGGIVANLPIYEAVLNGHDELVLIMDQPYSESLDEYQPLPGILGTIGEAVRSFEMLFWSQTWQQIQALIPSCHSLTVYAPQRGELKADYLDFSRETTSKTMAIGMACKPQRIK